VIDNCPEIRESQIETDLRELRRRSLLEEKEENRQLIFSFQPLVWEYAHYKAGDQRRLHQKAIEFYQQSLAIKREIGDRGGEAKTWFNLGLIYYKLDHISEAKEAYRQSRELFQALGLAEDIQDCDDKIQQLQTRKYPLIVAFFVGEIKFPLVLIGGIVIAVWQ
jgi:tetratricopeptide (TPR) repeat protein